MTAGRRPNFLVIMTDQHRADYLGCAGHPFLKTPAIDSLAARGTRFRRFYVSSPVCMPNRATFMTGRLPPVHGARGNGISLSFQANTFVDLLRARGWRTALVGKSHLMNMMPHPAMWKSAAPGGLAPAQGDFAEAQKPWAPESAYDQENSAHWLRDPGWKLQTPFYGFERVHLCTGHGDQVGGEYVHWLARKGAERAKLIGRENALPSDTSCPQAWRTAMPEELYPTRYIQDHALEVLDSFAQGAAEQPFFLMMSFPDPHHPFTPPGKYWDLYSAGQASLPESFHAPAPPGSLLYAARRAAEEPGYDREAAMTFLPLTERQAKEAIALSCGMIAMIDDAVAAVLARLAALGLDRDTVVVFTADHGDFLGDHGIALKGPMHLSSIVKVPFIWADPSRPQAATCDALAGTIDIAQTVLARAGLAGFNGMQGRSLLPEIETGRDTGPGAVLIDEESQRPAFGYAGPVRLRTMITERWRLSLYEHGPHAELFDLREDPHELRNLWNDPGFAKVKAELLERMVRESIHALDTSPAPNRRA